MPSTPFVFQSSNNFSKSSFGSIGISLLYIVTSWVASKLLIVPFFCSTPIILFLKSSIESNAFGISPSKFLLRYLLTKPKSVSWKYLVSSVLITCVLLPFFNPSSIILFAPFTILFSALLSSSCSSKINSLPPAEPEE